MGDTGRFNDLRAQYRSLWDAYQVVAHENAQLLHDGKRPFNEQIKDEKRAAAAVEVARASLLAAISRLGQ